MCALIDSGADPARVQQAYVDTPRHSRAAVVAALGARRHTAQQITDLLGTSKRQAERYLADHRSDNQTDETATDEEREATMTARAGDDGGHVACEPCGEIVDIPPGEALECPHSGDDDHAEAWAAEADVDDGPVWGDDDSGEDDTDDDTADAA